MIAEERTPDRKQKQQQEQKLPRGLLNRLREHLTHDRKPDQHDYQHDDNVLYTKTPFSRLITVTNWSSYTNYIEVNCEVQWQEKGKINRYVISTILYDWR